MREILFVAATEIEINSAKLAYDMSLKNANVSFLVTGIGVINTTYFLTKELLTNNYDLVVNIGLAGAYDFSLPLSEVVQISSEVFADLIMESEGKSKNAFEYGLFKANESPYTDGKLKNMSDEKIGIALAQYKKVSALTSSKVSDDTADNFWKQSKYSAEVESMEGAAFFEVCLREKVNFMEFRSISNYVGQRDVSLWKIKESLKNLELLCLEILDYKNRN